MTTNDVREVAGAQNVVAVGFLENGPEADEAGEGVEAGEGAPWEARDVTDTEASR